MVVFSVSFLTASVGFFSSESLKVFSSSSSFLFSANMTQSVCERKREIIMSKNVTHVKHVLDSVPFDST